MAGDLFLVHLSFPLDSKLPQIFQTQQCVQGTWNSV